MTAGAPTGDHADRTAPAAGEGVCACGCGRPPGPGSAYADDACRKNAWRSRQASARPRLVVVDASGAVAGIGAAQETTLLAVRLAELVPALKARLYELSPDSTGAALAGAAATVAAAEARAAQAVADASSWQAEAEAAGGAAAAAEVVSTELEATLADARAALSIERGRAEELAGELLVARARGCALEAEVGRLTDLLAEAARRAGWSLAATRPKPSWPTKSGVLP